MDWTVPHTFYPTAIHGVWSWGLFMLALMATAGLSAVIVRSANVKMALLLVVPIGAAMLVASMVLGMVVAFFVHDI